MYRQLFSSIIRDIEITANQRGYTQCTNIDVWQIIISLLCKCVVYITSQTDHVVSRTERFTGMHSPEKCYPSSLKCMLSIVRSNKDRSRNWRFSFSLCTIIDDNRIEASSRKKVREKKVELSLWHCTKMVDNIERHFFIDNH